MQAFKINMYVYNFIEENYDLFVSKGLLMPRFLAMINIPVALDSLRSYYLKHQSTAKYSYQEVYVKEFFKNIQRARYENFIFKLASAYSDLDIYFPTFIDFRARIYRAGVARTPGRVARSTFT